MTLDWATAHRMAMMAANQAHRDLGIARDEHVDVFAAMRSAGVCCLTEPLGNLAGAYAGAELGGPVTLLNSRLDEITLRHTAGHELGHHRFGHALTADLGEELDRGGLGGVWPDEEKLAEAFAAWFLMPLPAVRAAMRRAGFSRPASPIDVHQVACWLGTSFAGTARHLVNLKLASMRQYNDWTRSWNRHGPELRSSLAGLLPCDRVWVLGREADQASMHVLPGDTLVFRSGHVRRPLPQGLRREAGAQPSLQSQDVITVTNELAGPVSVTVTIPGIPGGLAITLIPAPIRLGIDTAWTLQPQHPGNGPGRGT